MDHNELTLKHYNEVCDFVIKTKSLNEYFLEWREDFLKLMNQHVEELKNE